MQKKKVISRFLAAVMAGILAFSNAPLSSLAAESRDYSSPGYIEDSLYESYADAADEFLAQYGENRDAEDIFEQAFDTEAEDTEFSVQENAEEDAAQEDGILVEEPQDETAEEAGASDEQQSEGLQTPDEMSSENADDVTLDETLAEAETLEASEQTLSDADEAGSIISWSYRQEDKGSEIYSPNCKIYLLDDEGKDREIVDERIENPEEDQHDVAYYKLESGKSYKLRIVPDIGYQLWDVDLGDYELTSVYGQIGVFSFTMGDTPLYLGNLVGKDTPIKKIESKYLKNVDLGGNESNPVISKLMDPDMGGNLMITVSDSNSYIPYGLETLFDNEEDYEKVQDLESLVTIDLDIRQAVCMKGMYDTGLEWWTKNIGELSADDKIKLSFDFNGNETIRYQVVQIVGDHLEAPETQYYNGKLSFETSSFSRFAILWDPPYVDHAYVSFDLGRDWENYVAYDEEKEEIVASAFDFSLRVGSEEYELIPEIYGEFVGEEEINRLVLKGAVPMGAKIAFKAASAFGYDKLTKADVSLFNDEDDMEVLETVDAVDDEIIFTLPEDEYIIDFDIYFEPVLQLVVDDFFGGKRITIDENSPAKKIEFGFDELFIAEVYNGSEIEDGRFVAPKIYKGATFKLDGTKLIPTGDESADSRYTLKDGIFSAVGNALGYAGASVPLEVTAAGKIFKATISFSKELTSIGIKGVSSDNTFDTPYGVTKEYKLETTKGTNAEEAVVLMINGEEKTLADFGYIDGNTFVMDADYMTDAYDPGESVKFGFFTMREQKLISPEYTVTFADMLKDKTPSVAQDLKRTDNRMLGLTLSLPQGVEASPFIDCEIMASAELDEDDETHIGFYNEFISSDIACFDLDTFLENAADDGEAVTYKVKTRLVYRVETDEGIKELGSSNYSEEISVSTKGSVFETKAVLTKKAPKQIYVGMNNVPIASVKWSEKTTCRTVDRAVLTDSNGMAVAVWNRRYSDDDGCLEVDQEGNIFLNTVYDEDDETFLPPGKYTVIVYPVTGKGKEISAKQKITVLDAISKIDITAPETVAKDYGKAVSFKATTALTGYKGKALKNKKLVWSVISSVERAEDEYEGYVETPISENSPLYGNITVKNGNVTLSAGLTVGSAKADRTFVLKAEAADFYESTVVGYSAPIEIKEGYSVPTYIKLRKYKPRTDTYDYSIIDDKSASDGKTDFYIYDVRAYKIAVFDQNGLEMDTTLKVTGATYSESGGLDMNKPGKVTIKATSTDGGKKSKTLNFNVSYTDGSFDPDVAIVNGNYDYLNKQDSDSFGDTTCTNDSPASAPLYVYVAGVKNAELVDGKVVKYDVPDLDHFSFINHSIKVEGGKLVSSMTISGGSIYEIIPTKHETKITLKDNTVDSAYNRTKTTKVYTVTNTGIIDSLKTFTIKASRSSIYRDLFVEADTFASEADNPNHIEYTIANAPTASEGKQLLALVNFDEDFWNDDVDYLAELLDIYNPIAGGYVVIKDGKFALDFYDDFIGYYTSPSINTGTYRMYITVGEGNYDEEEEEATDFVPLGKINKIKLKVVATKAASATISKSKYVLESANGEYSAEIGAAKVKNGYVNKNAYALSSVNTSGIPNNFKDLFEVRWVDGKEPAIYASSTIGEQYIEIDKNTSVIARDFYELSKLAAGNFKAGENGYYSAGGSLAGTEKKQKAAYKKWAKNNLTGYLTYGIHDYSTNYKTVFKKITVDISGCLSYAQEQEEKGSAFIKNGVYYYTSNEGNNIQEKDTYTYRDSYFTGNSYMESKGLVTLSAQIALASASKYGDYEDKYEQDYTDNGANITYMLSDIGFSDVVTNKYYRSEKLENSAAVAIGRKRLFVETEGGMKEYTLLAVIPRSAGYKEEWTGNFNVGKGDVHEGFREARDEALRFLKKYINDYGITGDVKIWTAGHSRGGAVANLLSGFLVGGGEDYFEGAVNIAPEDVYCYTFATPRTIKNGAIKGTTLKVEAERGGIYGKDTKMAEYVYEKEDAASAISVSDILYDCIRNYPLENDFITWLPPENWGFERYGQVLDIRKKADGTTAGTDEMLGKLAGINQFCYSQFSADGDPASFKTYSFDVLSFLPVEVEGGLQGTEGFKQMIAERMQALLLSAGSNVDYEDEGFGETLRAVAGIYGQTITQFGTDIIGDLAEVVKPLLFMIMDYVTQGLLASHVVETETEARVMGFAIVVQYFMGIEVDSTTTTVDDFVIAFAKYLVEKSETAGAKKILNALTGRIDAATAQLAIQVFGQFCDKSVQNPTLEQVVVAFLDACVNGPSENSVAYENELDAEGCRNVLYQLVNLFLGDKFSNAAPLLMNAKGVMVNVFLEALLKDLMYTENEAGERTYYDSTQEYADICLVELMNMVENNVLETIDDDSVYYDLSFLDRYQSHMEVLKKNVRTVRTLIANLFFYSPDPTKLVSVDYYLQNVTTFYKALNIITCAHYNEVFVAWAKAAEDMKAENPPE